LLTEGLGVIENAPETVRFQLGALTLDEELTAIADYAQGLWTSELDDIAVHGTGPACNRRIASICETWNEGR